MTVADILALRRPSSVQISPDGRRVAYVVTVAPLSASHDSAFLYVASGVGGARALARATHIARVSWSTDGRRLFYLAATEAGTRAWSVAVDGGTRRPLTPPSRPLHVEWESPDAYPTFQVSSDGSTLVYAVDDTLAARRTLDAGIRGGVVYSGGVAHGRRELQWWEVPFQLWALELASGRERRVWAGKSRLGSLWPQPVLSPDGKTIVLVSEASFRPDSLYAQRVSIVDVASGVESPLVSDLAGVFDPTWTDSGRTLQFVSSGPRTQGLSGKYAVYGVSLADPRLRLVTDDSATVWHMFAPGSAAGKALETEVEHRSGELLWGCGLDARGDRAACVAEAPTTPPEVVTVDVHAGQPGRVSPLTHLNPAYDHIALGAIRAIRWKNRTVEGKAGLVLPVDYRPGRRYPLLVMLYNLWGGRRFISDAVAFTSYPVQAFAGHGYAVVLMNEPSDAFSYRPGDFCAAKALEADGVAEAVRAVLDSLIGQSIADSTRLGIMGWSYGGFYTPYILSQHPSWFQAAALGEGGNHYPSLYWFGVADGYRSQENAFFGGGPSGKYSARWRAVSPVFTANRIRAPLLMEYSLSYEIGLELYRAIVDQGGEAEFVEYPDDKHVLFRPLNRYNSMTRHFDWFNFWLLGEEDPDPAKHEQYARWRDLRRAQAARPVDTTAIDPLAECSGAAAR